MGEVGTYKTIVATTEAVEGTFRDRDSTFLAYAYHINSREELEMRVQKLKAEHFKARHHCYAYRLLPDGSDYRTNDDGEPSGTAGKPILGKIDSYGLTYIAVIVVRYFGGTLLGTGGLIQAYKKAADNALTHVVIIDKDVLQRIEITCNLEYYHLIMQHIKGWQATVISETFDNGLMIKLEIPKKFRTLLRNFQENNPNFEVKYFK